MEQAFRSSSVRCPRPVCSMRQHARAVAHRPVPARATRQAAFHRPSSRSSAPSRIPPLQIGHSERYRLATNVLQQESAATVAERSTDGTFNVDQSQLRKLAQSRGATPFEGSSVDSVFQLADALLTSLDRGLSTNSADLSKRASAFGSNTLPPKEEVTLLCAFCFCMQPEPLAFVLRV